MSTAVKRIAIFGTESTGKTQLAGRLAEHFGVRCVAEYARECWERNGGVLALDDMLPIAREQWRREDEAVRLTAASPTSLPLVICDTEALTTMLWSDLLYGTCPEELRRGAEQRCRNYALYLLLDADVPFAPDPQRCFPEPADREKAARVWRGAVERRGLPFTLIRGDWAERERLAIAAIEQLLADGS